jgi:two-component system, OmpR family, sensor histidine kinase BaeS
MLKKLKTKLVLLTLGGTIFSIILVSLITNITLFRKYDLYMRNQQKNRISETIDLVQQSYFVNNGWTEKAIENIRLSPIIHYFDIAVKNEEGRIVFSHKMTKNTLGMRRDMMRRMHFNRFQNERNENYVIENYLLELEGEKIGSIDIGFIGPFAVSERDIVFTKGMNTSILYASIISIIIAILLGLYFSGIFIKPILIITEGANRLREGEMNTKVEIESNTAELQDLAQSINHLAVSLKRQEMLRKRLTTDISHELRTPLTILQSHLEAISDGIWEPTPDKLNICKSEVSRLIKLVEQLKNLTDIEKYKEKMEEKKLNLSRILSEIIEGFEVQFQKNTVHHESMIRDNIFIQGDQDKIKQVFINIIDNALNYTHSGGRVSTRLTEYENQAVIVIQDTGEGIEEKDLPYIFERLYRSDNSRNRKTGGSGIGLAIVHSLVKAHGGSIHVESKKGEGTKITVAFPKLEDGIIS